VFSIDQLLASPPLSALLSLLLIAGIDLVGAFALGSLGLIRGGLKDWVRWQAPIVGALLFAVVLYPLVLANQTPRAFMQTVATICIGAGLYQTCRAINWIHLQEWAFVDFRRLITEQSHAQKLLLLLLIGMGLLALGPVTNADALDYHMGVAIALLNSGGMAVTPEWFIGRLAGNGEVLNAMAISIGAEQFGALLQYVSLLGIAGIILFARDGADDEGCKQQATATNLIALAAFSAPILLFLISAPKPQMWPIAMTTFAFALVMHSSQRLLSPQRLLVSFALICALVMTASQAKFNYLLGGGVVGLLALGVMAKQRLFWASVGLGLIAAVLIVAPPILWKSAAFNTSWIDALIHPLPGHLPGTGEFVALAEGAADMVSPLPFPLLMLVPTSIGSFSTLLGTGWLVLIGLRPGQDSLLWAGIGAAAFMVVASAVLAPPSSRMYLEPYYWLLIILTLQPTRSALVGYSFLPWIVLSQALVVTAACWLGAVSLLPGALNAVWRTDIMQRSANGYEIMQWADTLLPKNAVVLNGHRSMALMPRDAVAFDWSNYVAMTDDESHLYLKRLKDRAVSHMLIVGSLSMNSPLSKCFGKVLPGPGVGHVATRNPLNQGGKYEAWIVEFDSARLPECARYVSTGK
jgi:hypothetical protein